MDLTKTPTLHLEFDPKQLKVDDIATAIERLLGQAGCDMCGRLSVRIDALEDPDWGTLQGIGSLRNVSVLPEQVVLARTFEA